MPTVTAHAWWDQYADMLPPAMLRLIAYEDAADRIWTYECHCVPGLLQTPAYAAAVIGSDPRDDPALAERGLQLRRTRQGVLRRNPPPALHAVVDETVVRRVAALDDADGQVAALLTAAAQPHVTLQVLPLAAGPVAAGGFPFTVLGFPSGPPVAYAETLTDARLVDDSETEVGRYVDWFETLRAVALGPDESAELVGRVAASG